MIDERLRAAAHDLQRDVSGPIPEFERPRSRALVVATVALAMLAGVGGLWAWNVRDVPAMRGSPSTEPSSSPVTSVAEPTTAVAEPTTAVTTTAVAALVPERVTDSELQDFIGKWSIDFQPAYIVLGSTGTVTFTLDMTESSYCIRFMDGSSCASTPDGSPMSAGPQAFSGGGGTQPAEPGGVTWERFLIVPADVQLQLMVNGEPACEMHRFSLEQFGNAALWACESTSAVPSVVDLAVTRGDRTLIATI